MKFSNNTGLSDIIHRNHLLLPVINRFGIRLGLGEMTVEEVCRKYNVNVNFFLEVINAYNDPDYFPEKKLAAFPASMIVNYLQKTHKYYTGYVIPEIENLLNELVESCQTDCRNLYAVKKFYEGFKIELMNHIKDEEENVFPYVLQLEKSSPANKTATKNEYSIHSFEEEHQQVDEKLLDLKNIVIKFLPPSYDDNVCNAFLSSVFQFEKDLKDHARIEDKILIPAVKALENRYNQ